MDITHDFWIDAPAEAVFEAISTEEGLNAWWTETCRPRSGVGSEYEFGFGPGFDWRGSVTAWEAGKTIEWRMTQASEDWRQTRVGFRLLPAPHGTNVQFYHLGWPEANGHFRTSSFCWAMYLRLLKQYVERGSVVPYSQRLEA